MGFQRTPEQEAAVRNRGGTLLVSAAAGSGKTRVLVERLLDRVIGEDRNLDEFLIITFTRAAAEELRARISAELSRKLIDTPQDRHLRRQTALLYKTQISTIHAFCTVLLRECGHILDIPADFTLCEEEEAEILMLRVLNEVLERRYEKIEPDSDFGKLLDILSAGRDDSRLMEIVLDVYGRIQSHPDPEGWMRVQNEEWDLSGIGDVSELPWGKLLLADAEKTVSYWKSRMEEALRLAAGEEKLAAAYTDSLQATAEGIDNLLTAIRLGWDQAAVQRVPFPRLKPVRNCEDVLTQQRIKALREKCKDTMEKLAERFACTSVELLADLRHVQPAMRGLFDLVQEFSEAYRVIKRRKGMLDFSDLEHEAVHLLTRPDGTPSELALTWGIRFTEIMVDEYQDTNQVQNVIFDALSNQGRNLFLVGDVKQSIYRFRLADPTIFLRKYRNFVTHEQAEEGQERKVTLSQNFRSRPEVLDAANYLFRSIMSKQLGEMDYTAAEALYPGGSFPDGKGYATELHVLDFTALSDQDGEKLSKNKLEAEFVAERIKTLLREKFPVSDGQGGTRPVRPEDIVILLRSPGTVRQHYWSALRKRNLPCSEEETGDLFAATEVSVALAFLQIIDNPHQDIPLISVLRSPVFSFSADRLAEIRTQSSGDFFSALQEAGQSDMEDCAEFLKELEELRFGAGEKSSHKLIWSLYQKTGMLEIYGGFPGGEERKSNLLALYELAERFESNGHRGLFGFLTHLARVREIGTVPTLPGGSGSQGGIKILSIHRSKGLEFPVVFLCGLGKRFNYSDIQKPVLFHSQLGLGPKGLDESRMVEFTTLARQAVALQLKKEMLAEEMRLLYVAMTRAKEKLIMTHTLSYGESELKKLMDDASSPVDPQVLASCSCTGHWIILAAMARPEGSALRDGIADFNPILDYDAAWIIQKHSGVSGAATAQEVQEDQNSEAPDLPIIEEILTQLFWQYPYQQLAGIPAKITATQIKNLSREKPFFMDNEKMAEKAPEFRRPRFAAEEFGLSAAQKGTAFHTVLQSIDFSKTNIVSEIREEIERLTEAAYLTRQQADSINPNQILMFFSSSIGQKLKTAENLHREYPFSVLIPACRYYPGISEEEKILLQGVIDCWFETEEGITIVDFKTDRVTGKGVEIRAHSYLEQMEAYRFALEQVIGKPVIREILWFTYPNLGVEFSGEELAVSP